MPITKRTWIWSSVSPEFNLYDQRWPIRTRAFQAPPAKFVFAQEGQPDGTGGRFHCLARLHHLRRTGQPQRAFAFRARKQLLRSRRIDPAAARAPIGRYSRIRRAIIDQDVMLPENSRVGFDAEEDRALGRVVTDSGITVVPSPVPHNPRKHFSYG